jgi:DNA-binding transcriptional regulator LsrR (DeoR family)
MYYIDQKNQAEIAKRIGVTRSMVSRILTEARESGIVEIRIRRPVQADRELESALISHFDLKDACVVSIMNPDDGRLLRALGAAGAQILKRYLAPKQILGLAWGTSISSTVDAFEVSEPMNVRVVQMVGAMGARNLEYDGHHLVSRISEKLGGEAYYLNAPFICPNEDMAKALLETRSIKETITLSKKSDVALLGIGTTLAEYSSFYLAGSVSFQELNHLQHEGSIGDVCGLHFDKNGLPSSQDFSERLVTIRHKDLSSIPVRLGVAGGEGKVQAILGALRGKYINVLVTDSTTARKVLDLANNQ